MRAGARFVAAAVLPFVAAATARAQPSSQPAPVRLLDVPYIQQSEALCGGAAAAMVMRYWGATGVYAETFAPLVDRAAGGIRAEDLLGALRERGWEARSFRGDVRLVQARLGDGQPVIALIEDRPGAFHYVVVLAWANGRVVHHDPARAPFRVAAEDEFLHAWEASGRWTLLALPSATRSERPTVRPSDDSSAPRSGSVCGPLVSEAVKTATGGGQESALRTLAAAADLCPTDPSPWREMAGVYALREAWSQAATHAREAVRRDPNDQHAWRILATSRYVTDDTAGALDAWNAVGEPVIDIVNVRGLEHTRHQAATAAMRLQPRAVLTRNALGAAARRLADVPAAQVARVNYRPLPDGRAAVDAVLIERPRSPLGLAGLTVMGIRAVSDREVVASAANLTGAGDVVTASWRWWENRPRITMAYAAPVSFGGVVRADAFRDEQTYGAGRLREVRQGGGLTWSDWTTGNLRWEVGVGADSWRSRGTTATITAGVDRRLAGDRVSLKGSAAALGGSFSTWASAAAVDWRSSPRHEGHVLLARTGVALAGGEAPMALWAGAGLGHARSVLLRAHPLLDDGIVTGEVFGRRVYFAAAEWRRWSRPLKGPIRLAPAVFVDSARAANRLAPGGAWHADAGAGLRLTLPGTNVLRVDVAQGLRDGATVVSIGWIR